LSRIVVGITGATGSIIGVRLLEVMRESGIETHLIMSRWGARTMSHETSRTVDEVNALASQAYNPNDQGASISSGSFLTDGMVIAPCSMRTLAAIASGQGEHLVHRAADVILKERRKLVLVVRESPLSEIHLENMLKLARMGVVILPPMPGFYNHPKSVDEMVDHIVMRILDQFGIHIDLTARWDGEMSAGNRRPSE
jgi:4-hydroxy-3-polyprenylbenzoate decarboxylase